MKRLACLLWIALLAHPAFAEVAVERNTNGSFKNLRVGSHAHDGFIYRWDRNGAPKESDLLNQGGDSLGDDAPATLVLPAGKYQSDPMPVVIWPRNTGTDHDIYYSRWLTGSGWTAYEEISQGNLDEDMGAQIYLDPKGDAHAVWWTNSRVPGVWYSKLVDGHWTHAELITAPGQDCRNPVFVFSCNGLYVSFENWSTTPMHRETSLKERFDP